MTALCVKQGGRRLAKQIKHFNGHKKNYTLAQRLSAFLKRRKDVRPLYTGIEATSPKVRVGLGLETKEITSNVHFGFGCFFY